MKIIDWETCFSRRVA